MLVFCFDTSEPETTKKPCMASSDRSQFYSVFQKAFLSLVDKDVDSETCALSLIGEWQFNWPIETIFGVARCQPRCEGCYNNFPATDPLSLHKPTC